MLNFLIVLMTSLALSLGITRFSINILKKTPSKPGHSNAPNAFKKPPYIYFITVILFLILFKLMFHVLSFISLGLQ
ncbi:MAG: hypothetical protein APF84_08550 [Gracilibacter sp. BRH_c7a]|nr:MAG: hypothetical protein APF84_08550 [Gracilibacter sp. BRH_c7a]